jgi:transcriptional regulator with XRE-family HTH domain
MASSRRPGRVQQIAYDATPLTAAQPDIDARLGWLLAMSRLHHPNRDFADGRKFVESLADAGLHVSRSQLSRWESGEAAVSFEAIEAYERALGLAPGEITSLAGYVRSSIPGLKTRVLRPRLEPASRDFALRLDELIDVAEAGRAKAVDWQELGWHLAAAPLVHLRGSTWESLAHEIVTIIPRSINVAYRQYSNAARSMALVPRAQDFLTDAIATYISNPNAQVITNPLGLLDQLPTRRAADLVLDLIEHPPKKSAYYLAIWVATSKVLRGDFTADERTRLGMIVLRIWRANPAQAARDLAELVAALPEGLRASLTDAASRTGQRRLRYVIEHGEGLVASEARTMAWRLAEGARQRAPGQPEYGEDRMLLRLIREVLFHRDSERRHLAALVIASSPFRGPVAEELIGLLGEPGIPEWVRGRAATTIRYLAEEGHRLRLLHWLQDPDADVAAPVAQALGHLPFAPVSDQAVRAALGAHWSPVERARMYALGMTGSAALRAINRSSSAPQWQQAAARWWIQIGPAVSD